MVELLLLLLEETVVETTEVEVDVCEVDELEPLGEDSTEDVMDDIKLGVEEDELEGVLDALELV